MAKKKKNIKMSCSEPARLNMPEQEKMYSWLAPLLDSYYTADQEIFESLGTEIRKGRVLACAKGCSSCCSTHVTIPVYPMELMGIYLYLLDIVPRHIYDIISVGMADFIPGKGCPFLVEGACGVHQMRPLACRFFNVFSKPCAEGEDPYYSRRNDVWTPEEKQKNKALSKMLPFYGFIGRNERREAVKNGYLIRFVRNLQEINWPGIALRLNNRDRSPVNEKGFPH